MIILNIFKHFKQYDNRKYIIKIYFNTIFIRNFVIYALLSYYTYILDITTTVGIFRIPYKCHEI